MASTQLTIALNTRPLLKQIEDVAWLLQYVPKSRARTLYRKLLILLDRRDFYQVCHDERFLAGRTDDCVVRLRLLGLDELLAATFRAAKFRDKVDFSHASSPGSDLLHLVAAALAGSGEGQGVSHE